MQTNSILRRPFRFRFFNATLYLIAANVLIFALGYVWPMVTYALALSPQAVMAGWVWQVFTYMFAHAIYAFSGAWNTMLLGASGAVFALLLAFGVLYPKAMVYLYGIIPIRAPLMVIGYTAIEIVFTLLGAASSVAHLTHLAGFVAGAAYFPVRLGMNPFKRLRER